MERDGLAKKYRASADSFKQGILRDKIAKLVSNQKTLLQVVRNQKEATLKVIAHQQSRRSDANNRETSPTLLPCDPSPGRHQISAVNEWLEANTANGSTMTTKIPAVDSVPDSESNQFPRTISRHISSSEISRTVEVPAVSLISERTAPHDSNLTSKRKPEGAENGPLSFDSCSSVMNDHLASIARGSKSHNAFPVSITLEMIEKNYISVEKISQQTAAERHQTSDQQLQRPSYEKAIQQADDDCPVLTDVSAYRRLQLSAIGPRSYTSNQNVHHNDVSILASEKQQKCVETEKKTRKFPLRKLMKLGTLKPGVDVLSFQLQDYSHKATLLCDGQVTDCSGVVFRDPVQWLKALLGNNISVTWKYVADKVTYTGKKLSSFIAQEDYAKTERDPDPEGNITATPSHQPPGHTVLQVNEILLVDKSEFFPSHIMDRYWEEFMTCDNHDV
ncbi:ankyrin repeat domain-containing protein 31 [Bufo gargarizans]|uniref:ankyrin repeat domain-containing protein 31 n=1 Tax=Bufo gargarizans TaxID=30331 RepID=UPI001CF2CB09|nr:ankyrin repeat domain-containing protein 31 [Bufo gargarizans]